MLASAPHLATADDCLDVVFTPPAAHPSVLGRVVSVRWTTTPCANPRSFECALSGGTAAEIADVTIQVRRRWAADGARVPIERRRLRVVGPMPRRRGACGPAPLDVGSLRVFVLGEELDGAYRIVTSHPWRAMDSHGRRRGGS
jgi:hypothetical protein